MASIYPGGMGLHGWGGMDNDERCPGCKNKKALTMKSMKIMKGFLGGVSV